MVVEATSEQVAQVTFTVTAQDDVDGAATLEEDGTTTTQHDDVGGDITIACSPASGSIFPLGDSLVQCSARDATGNFVRGSFTVTVNSQPPPPDVTRPVITVPEDITEEATSPDGATVSFEVSAQDDEDGPTDVDCDHNSGETFPIGETVVTCSAEDLAGNRADDKSFKITVQDTTAPEVEITEASDRRNGRGEIAEGSTTNMRYIEITFEATDAVGTDNTECSLDGAAFTLCTSPLVYDILSKITHQVTVRVTDALGNTGEGQFTWTVRNPSAAAAPGRQ
jgi:HYR domain